ncbi:MAG TPA: AraC family transcriptional regulator [Puia sp.]|nr:AraC family transcriptional regulator [Puia sp.]
MELRREDRESRLIEKAEELALHLRLHSKEPLLLGDYARMLAINAQYLNAAFKRRFGVSIPEYRRMVRLEEAKRLLTETGWSLGKIAVETGFCDAAYLGNVFKKKFRMTAMEWRRGGE